MGGCLDKSLSIVDLWLCMCVKERDNKGIISGQSYSIGDVQKNHLKMC